MPPRSKEGSVSKKKALATMKEMVDWRKMATGEQGKTLLSVDRQLALLQTPPEFRDDTQRRWAREDTATSLLSKVDEAKKKRDDLEKAWNESRTVFRDLQARGTAKGQSEAAWNENVAKARETMNNLDSELTIATATWKTLKDNAAAGIESLKKIGNREFTEAQGKAMEKMWGDTGKALAAYFTAPEKSASLAKSGITNKPEWFQGPPESVRGEQVFGPRMVTSADLPAGYYGMQQATEKVSENTKPVPGLLKDVVSAIKGLANKAGLAIDIVEDATW
jgi:hypothetical protein